MKFKIGDVVKIVRVKGIYFGDKYFKNGELTTVIKVAKTGEPYLYNGTVDGLIITDDEFRCIEIIKDGDDSK